jgi:hypothetical protein
MAVALGRDEASEAQPNLHLLAEVRSCTPKEPCTPIDGGGGLHSA